MIKLSGVNPAPFIQPLLTLTLEDKETWYVDVGGKIDVYLNRREFKRLCGPMTREVGLSGENLNKVSSPLLRELARGLSVHGVKVVRVGIYDGSAGPSHILRHGVFFRRMNHLNQEPFATDALSWMKE